MLGLEQQCGFSDGALSMSSFVKVCVLSCTFSRSSRLKVLIEEGWVYEGRVVEIGKGNRDGGGL